MKRLKSVIIGFVVLISTQNSLSFAEDCISVFEEKYKEGTEMSFSDKACAGCLGGETAGSGLAFSGRGRQFVRRHWLVSTSAFLGCIGIAASTCPQYLVYKPATYGSEKLREMQNVKAILVEAKLSKERGYVLDELDFPALYPLWQTFEKSWIVYGKYLKEKGVESTAYNDFVDELVEGTESGKFCQFNLYTTVDLFRDLVREVPSELFPSSTEDE